MTQESTVRARRGWLARWPRAVDAALGILIVTSVALAFDTSEGSAVHISLLGDVTWLGVLIGLASGLSMMWRRSRPAFVAVFNAGVVVVWWLLGYSGDPSLGLFVSLYSVGRYEQRGQVSYGVAAGAVLLAIGSAVVDGLALLDGAVVVVVSWVPWYVGRRVLARHAYLEMLEERAVFLERERQAELGRAVAEERAAIARELHDVVAHRVSMMTVQAGAAKTVGLSHPADAVGAMAAIEEEGRMALSELRDLLGVLRTDTGVEALQPRGALADIPDLTERMRSAGYDVEVSIRVEEPAAIPSRVGLSVYRVVQESLTNVVKHAGPGARVSVVVGTDDGRMVVLVEDDGIGVRRPHSGGHGLVGMRERMALLGGDLEVGPRPGGGWRVRAWVPMVEVGAT